MRYTFPILTLCKGGAQRILVEITDHLTRRGHQVTILMPDYGVVEYPVESRIVFTGRHDLIESDYPEADVIVSNYYLSLSSAQAASENGKGRHIRYSLCYESAVLPENHKSYPSYHATSRLMVLSNWQKQLMSLLYGIDSHVVPVGVDRVFHNRHLRERQPNLTIAAILRRPEGFSLHRGQEYLIEQLDAVKAYHPDVNIHFITPPNEFSSSPVLQTMKASGRYAFFTPQDDTELAECYNRAHIFVTPSTYESFCMPGLEAMSCGAALAAVYSGGNMDYCVPGANCLMSYRHENRLSEHILQLVENPGLRTRLAEQGEKDAKKWTWESSADLFERAVRELMKEHAQTASRTIPGVTTRKRGWAGWFRRSSEIR